MVDLIQLEDRFKTMTSELDGLNGRCLLLQEQTSNAENKLVELNHKKEVYTKSVELLTFISEVTKQKLKIGLESMTTYALLYVFNEDYKFLVEFDRRGNLQEIDFKILPPGRTEASDPLDSIGGGVLDVVSFVLRIIAIELSKPRINGFIAYDEPCKHLSTLYRLKMGEFFRYISQELNHQLIIVTHFEELKEYADKQIKIE